MFNPSKEDVRRFFFEAWHKHCNRLPCTPLETVAAYWIAQHPEYHSLLEDLDTALNTQYCAEQGQSNPFMHLSMHLALSEQISIDQPLGIRAIFEKIAAHTGDAHTAAHEAMESLGRVLWEAQNGSLPPDPESINEAYLAYLRRRLN